MSALRDRHRSPVQKGSLLAKRDVKDLLDAERSESLEANVAETDAAAAPFGPDAVPLRPTADRDVDRESEERVRLVVGGKRRSPRRPRPSLLIAVPLILAAALFVASELAGSDRRDSPHRAESEQLSRMPKTPPVRSEPRSLVAPARSLGQPQRGNERKGDLVSSRPSRPSHRSLQHSQNSQPRRSRGAEETATADAGPAPEPGTGPAPEPESSIETAPAPAPSPAPEPTPSPEPEGTPVQTSPSESHPSEQSEVEDQFGFER